jgi:DNA-binding transcriptional MerR regulator
MRLDDLARAAGVATTTVRLYQNKGLLPGPRLVGRTGYYDEHHLARLRLIGRLQDEGFSLASIGRLLESWEQGRELSEIVGVEQQLDLLLSRGSGGAALVLDPIEFAERFPEGMLTPELVQRATALGLVEPTEDGRIRVPDRRFLETGPALARLGIPPDVILDEWERLVEVTDGIADRFVSLFETQILPADWRTGLDGERARELAGTLDRLRRAAEQVMLAALDASIARIGAQRLAELIPQTAEDSSAAP